jgi:hypothetical protein
VERPPGRLLELLRLAGPQSSGKCPPGANDTEKPEKMWSVNAMSTEVLDNLIKQAEMLSPDEQLRLAAYLVERARQSSSSPRRMFTSPHAGNVITPRKPGNPAGSPATPRASAGLRLISHSSSRA